MIDVVVVIVACFLTWMITRYAYKSDAKANAAWNDGYTKGYNYGVWVANHLGVKE